MLANDDYNNDWDGLGLFWHKSIIYHLPLTAENWFPTICFARNAAIFIAQLYIYIWIEIQMNWFFDYEDFLFNRNMCNLLCTSRLYGPVRV